MSPEDLRDLLRQRPFRPVQLTFSDGSQHVIPHPEMVLLTRSSVSIGKASDPESGIADRTSHFSLSHLVRVDPVMVGR